MGGPVLAGVVLDFREAEGDRIEFGPGAAALVGVEAVGDVLAHLRSALPATVPPVAGRRLSFDVDGDGRADAFVLTTDTAGPWLEALRGPSQPPPAPPPPLPGREPAPGPLSPRDSAFVRSEEPAASAPIALTLGGQEFGAEPFLA